MSYRATRVFYPTRPNQGDRGPQEDAQPTQQSAPNPAPRGIRPFRGSGRGQRNATASRAPSPPTFSEESQIDDSRNNWLDMCARHLKLKMHFPDLPCFRVDEDILDAVIGKRVKSLPGLRDLDGELNPENYVEPLKQLLAVEEVHQAIEMRKFDMIKKLVDRANHCIDMPGLSNGQPSLVPGDTVAVYDDDFNETETFYILTTRGDKIILNERKVDKREELLKKPVNIALVAAGTQFDTCRRALEKSRDSFIQEIISEAPRANLQNFSKTIDLQWTKGEFGNWSFTASLSDASWLKSLFTTKNAHEDTLKILVVNPGMWPVLRGYPYTPDSEPEKGFVLEISGLATPSDNGYVIMQSPTSLKTVLLPMKVSNLYQFTLDTDRCNAIREFFHEGAHDVMFVSTAMVEEAQLTGPMEPSVQESLRDLFRDSREQVDYELLNRTPKQLLSAESDFGLSQMSKFLDSRLNKLNGPQRQAVVAIMEARYRPRPYILFGPPGTGKTHTLVEAVVQIHKRNKQMRILFCANSNTCADQIFEKLERTGLIDSNDVERIRAGDRVAGLNFRNIIVTTNIKAGSLMTDSEHWRSKFDYVFLDEAGHAHEPESLIPICSLARDGCLVLAGDPKQLGPVVQCQQASDLGLGRSMLERIFKFEAYQKQEVYARYNKFFITKLLHCYRCDPNILEISNRLFYENELLYVNRTPKSLLKILNLKQSVQFRHVTGRENKPEWSTSWRNYQEVEACVDILMRLYKMGFDAEQIGLITPYKLQSKEIVKRLKVVLAGNSRLLNARFPSKSAALVEKSADEISAESLANELEQLGLSKKSEEIEPTHTKPIERNKIVWTEFKRDWLCKIDTVDAFQGNEREVIIVSTVRTGPRRNLDFLNDARRFNVAVSRAKWLVIVVGDKNTISGGNYWSEFYKLAEKNDLSKWPRTQTGGREDPHSHAIPLFRH